MTKHDCENYATCVNYAPKHPKAPEHVAGERCDAPVRCGYENDSIDRFEYTGEYGTAYNTWFLCFCGEIVYAHISFPDVWILRPVPKAEAKAEPKFKVGDWVVGPVTIKCSTGMYIVGKCEDVGGSLYGIRNDEGNYRAVEQSEARPARLSDFEREVNGVRVLMRENDSETYELTLPRSSLHDSEAIIGYWVEIKAKGGAYQLAKALGLTIAPASVKE